MTKANQKIDIPSNPFDRRAWVHFQLRLKNTSFAEVARSAGVTREAMYATMFMPSQRLEKIIADAIGVPVEVLFEERYIGGRRVHRTRKKTASHDKVNDAAAGCTVDSSEAA
jgi:lambda repressor-like predicted transcriptional regulator